MLQRIQNYITWRTDTSTLTKWLVNRGKSLHRGDVMALVETADGEIELRAAFTGRLAEKHVPSGGTLRSGERVATFDIPRGMLELKKPRSKAESIFVTWSEDSELVEELQKVARRFAGRSGGSKKEKEKRLRQAKLQVAQQATGQIEQQLGELRKFLDSDNLRGRLFDWKKIEERVFQVPPPERSKEPAPPKKPRPPSSSTAPTFPREPQRTDPEYQVKRGVLDTLLPSRIQKKQERAEAQYNKDHERWQKAKEEALVAYQTAQEVHENKLKRQEATYQKALAAHERKVARHNANYQSKRERWKALKEKACAPVKETRKDLFSGKPDIVENYAGVVLEESSYPEYIPRDFEAEYIAETRTLILDHSLPSRESLPMLREVGYVQRRDAFDLKYLSIRAADALYDTILYQLVLHTFHELFEADEANVLDAIVFNGYVRSVDPATGQEVSPCVLSLHTSKDEFMALNLAKVEPKACFKKLKGVGSSKLHSMTPVAPIMMMSRDDSRFTASRAIAAGIQDGDNLAAMDWEDFEHLIRELFEQEFSQGGAEVRVTRASRDGGVDAIAFDPDPIRGGKIVIQAKRYTNTVGVAAVRDLYGTVMNEGANKGILVTTSDYGPDAYGFAKDKPITLLNGGNLLNLLEKHGHKARIDIREAKRLK